MRRAFVPIILAMASPAAAKDGGVYVAIEGGAAFPLHTDYDVQSTRVQTVPTGSGLLGQTVTTTNTRYGTGLTNSYDTGYDVDGVVGYDFGHFRVEAEVGYKRTDSKNLTASSLLLTDVNTAPIKGVTSAGFALGTETSVVSGMVNALVDFNLTPDIRIYGGGGVGGARVKALGSRDDAVAYQGIAGAAYAVSPSVEIGVKYRYFQTDRVRFNGTANFADAATGATSASQFVSSGKFRSNSVLLSLTYNFGGDDSAR